jgi:hypothetical protein
MFTARPLTSPAAPLPRPTDPSFMTRFGGVLKALIARRARHQANETVPVNVPVAGRVAAISSVGFFSPAIADASSRNGATQRSRHEIAVAPSFYASRRPGVQGRWKSTDRVAMN